MKSIKKSPFVAAGFFLGTLIFSAIFFANKNSVERYLFYFHSFENDQLCTEVRYLPKNPTQGKIQLFVDELLLGPMTNRYKSIFVRGTKVEFCTLEGNTLYVGLSSDALQTSTDTENLRERVSLFKLNIVKKFTEIKTVLVYIDGKSAF